MNNSENQESPGLVTPDFVNEKYIIIFGKEFGYSSLYKFVCFKKRSLRFWTQ